MYFFYFFKYKSISYKVQFWQKFKTMCDEQIEIQQAENQFQYEEPQYQYVQEQPTYPDFQEEENVYPIYSPQQLFLLKKPSIIQDQEYQDFQLDQSFGRDNSRRPTCQIRKKVCVKQNDDESTTMDESFDDLEKLAQRISQETQKKFTYSKSFPLPTPSSVEMHLIDLQMRFPPTHKQEDFLAQYIKSDDLLRIKIGLTEEMINDEESQKFEEWVEQLCTSTNHQSLKEMARRQKVKRYLEKKHSRTYEKKVHYHIRQKVAEERLRVKGRFVTWNQALKMLNETQEFFQMKSLEQQSQRNLLEPTEIPNKYF
ncbi:hypothetical protein pb186bvf_004695 [Paramecium bursaria]